MSQIEKWADKCIKEAYEIDSQVNGLRDQTECLLRKMLIRLEEHFIESEIIHAVDNAMKRFEMEE